MTVSPRQTPEQAIQSSLGAIRSVPTFSSTTVGTSATLAIADAASSHGVRRVRLLNKHASNFLGLILLAAGATVSGSLADSIQVGPGQALEIVVGANMRMALIASASSTDFNLAVHDLL